MRLFQIIAALCMMVAGVATMLFDPSHRSIGVAAVLVGFALVAYFAIRRAYAVR